MQIIVLGMHRSGTSALTGLLHQLGAYVGPLEIMDGATPENPRGYWERCDVQALNDALLATQGCEWPRVARFELGQIPDGDLAAFEEQTGKLIQQLNPHQPWAIKDPRFCLLLPVWRRLLDKPVCVLVYRHPVEVALSLNQRDHFPLSFGIALWEKYVLSALSVTQGLPLIAVSHQQLVSQPVALARSLFEQLTALGVRHMRPPSADQVRLFIDDRLYRARNDHHLDQALLNPQQIRLFELLNALPASRPQEVPALSPSAELALRDYEHVERALMQYQQTIYRLQHKVTALEDQLKQEKLLLQRHLEALLQAVDSVSSSMSWRTVSGLTRSLRKLQGQPADETAAQHLARTQETIRSSLRQLSAEPPDAPPH